MRILMTADTVGGVWTYALELARALEPHGAEVHLATMGRHPEPDQRAEAARAPLASLHESEFALEWQEDPWQDVERAGEWLLGLERELAPDVVHLNGYAHGALAWAAPALVVAHSDVLSWWQAVHGRPAPRAWGPYRTAAAAGLQAAAGVCAPTQAVIEDLRRSFAFATPTRVVRNGRSWPYAPREKEPLVVGIGRFWDEAKNVAALERVRAKAPWRVVTIGPGTDVGRLPADAVAGHLARAAVFASPARYEPFGLAALEAALAGCALVLGDIPSLRELWDGAALFVPPDDDEALAAALRLLATDDEVRTRLAGAARGRAGRYAPDAMARGYVEVYGAVRAAARETVRA